MHNIYFLYLFCKFSNQATTQPSLNIFFNLSSSLIIKNKYEIQLSKIQIKHNIIMATNTLKI